MAQHGSPATAPEAPTAWHGKLPTLGDFAGRRMPPAFLDPWDAWLSAGLLALREADPAGWLQAYLAAPSWRFVLMPGVMSAQPGAATPQAWAGVLMPSVDRVGRYFPLTLVRPLASAPATGAELQRLWAWLSRLDELAGDALHEDWTAERLEDELARMAPPALQADGWGLGPGLSSEEAQPTAPPPPGCSLWRAHGAESSTHAGATWAGRGLPSTAASLLGATMPVFAAAPTP